MPIEGLLLAALVERFAGRGMRMGVAPDPLVVFPAKHAAVGDLRIWRPRVGASSSGTIADVDVAIGDIVFDNVVNFDFDVDLRERGKRITCDVVRLLQQLFNDQLYFWKSTDGRNSGWRECVDPAAAEPLVHDNRTYRTYIWSGPLGEWRASAAMIARGRIRDAREYEICRSLIDPTAPEAIDDTERDVLLRLIADYERDGAV
jgi:hypothetical protein